MSNETFQIIITTAVALAFLALVVQGLVAVAFYRSGRDLVSRISPFLSRTKAILTVEKDSIRRVEIVIDKTLRCADILERVAPRLVTLAARTENVAVRAMHVGERVGELEHSVKLVGTSAHFVSLEVHPIVVSVGAEASGLVRSAGAQLRRFRRVVYEAIGHFTHLREVIASR